MHAELTGNLQAFDNHINVSHIDLNIGHFIVILNEGLWRQNT